MHKVVLLLPIGLHTTYHPEILKQARRRRPHDRAHLGLHQRHLDAKKMTEAQAKEEIEKGFSAVKMALGAAPVLFAFRACPHAGLQRTIAARNIAMFSCDIDSNDFKSSSS